jgi:pantothenate kinase
VAARHNLANFAHDVGDIVADAIVVPAHVKLVIVEGLYLLLDDEGWRDASALLDERWYLDTPMDVAMERLAQRHYRPGDLQPRPSPTPH